MENEKWFGFFYVLFHIILSVQEEVYAGLGQHGRGVAAAGAREHYAVVVFRKESTHY